MYEHRIPRHRHHLYARDYPGTGPAFVLMHGFPDNLGIYDALAPLLAQTGRRVIAFDFLGYGDSDKPANYRYTAKGMEGDLDAVVAGLDVGPIIPVAHDASGPPAINWVLDHQAQVAALVLLNTFYDAAPTLRFPEFIALFADPAYADLAAAFLGDPAQFRWLLQFQARQFLRDAPPELREWAQRALVPVIQRQFAATPNAGPAFMGLTRDLRASVEANTRRASRIPTTRPIVAGRSTARTASSVPGLAAISQSVPSAAPFAAECAAHAKVSPMVCLATADSGPSPTAREAFIAANRRSTASAITPMKSTDAMATTSHAGRFGHIARLR
jgi:pimeloyl-ACP methyl ester carboxylesterase